MLQTLLGSAPIRRLTDFALGQYAHRRVRRLDRMPVDRVQERTLLRLVHRARHTAFGRAHDFSSVRGLADYQARVPLRDYEAMWEQWWREPFPFLKGVSGPDHVPYFGLSSGTTSGATKYLPLTRPLLASNTKAALTSLSWFLHAHPGTPLFTGRLFFLGGSTDLQDLSANHQDKPRARAHSRFGPILGGDLSGVTTIEAPSWMRPFSFPPVEMALIKDWEEKMTRLARAAAAMPITMLSGVPSWMLVLFDRLRQVTGKERIADIWPQLRLILHGGTKFDPYRELFREQVGSDAVKYAEVYPASEAYIAAEDHRYGLLRLIPDADIFYEFVPVAELDSPRPSRHTLADLELGVNYAVVLTTCAGLWSYVLGDTVLFERRQPPLLRFTGRTKYFLSAFGEHLISEEVERAVAAAAGALASPVVDFHVGPVFPDTPNRPGMHRYLVEFAGAPPDLGQFAGAIDALLRRINEDYDAHRQGDLTMLPPEVVAVPRGGFAAWMKAHGKLGGQHKVPRMDNSGAVTRDMERFFALGARGGAAGATATTPISPPRCVLPEPFCYHDRHACLVDWISSTTLPGDRNRELYCRPVSSHSARAGPWPGWAVYASPARRCARAGRRQGP